MTLHQAQTDPECRREVCARGFSLVELLVSLAVCALLSAAVAGVVPSARVAFDAAPVALDLQQRGRSAVDAFAAAIRSARSAVAVIPLSPSGSSETGFDALYVVTPAVNAAQGVLEFDQPGPQGLLTLAAGAGCPGVPEVCGFTPGTLAAIMDGAGRFDVFTVASANGAIGEIAATAALASAYPAGSVVVEVDTHHFRLDDQPDGSRSLVRETGGGATQPVVDNVAAMRIEVWRGAPPMVMSAAEVDDGPFLAGGPDGSYDADLLAVNRVDLQITLEAPRQSRLRTVPPARTLHATFALRNVAAPVQP